MQPDDQTSDQPADEETDTRLNDRSDYQLCFACGVRNVAGLQLTYRQVGERIVTEFMPDARWQGFPGYVHGGVLATVLDETLERVSLAAGQWMMTGRLEVRFRRAALVGQRLVVAARLVARRGRAIVAEATAHAGTLDGAVIAEARATFLPLPASVAGDVTSQYPRFMRAFAPGGDELADVR
jgi:acyl-coenzyme A thioesterase PaaI-like protein